MENKGKAPKKIIIFSIVALISIGIVKSGISFVNPEPVTISINTTETLGQMPEVLQPGLMGSVWDKYEPVKYEVGSLNRKPIWRLHLGLGNGFPDGHNETKPDNFELDFSEWLNKNVNPQIKLYQNAGYQVIITLSTVPKWLSLYPYNEEMPFVDQNSWFFKWAYSPPKDYLEWEKLIKLLVQTQKADGIKADYIIWDEPDWMFYGTEEQYLELYSHTANAIKEVDQAIQVGAPGVGNWKAQKYLNCPAEATGLTDGECPTKDHSMIGALISYVAQNHVPLDFIDWHFPNKDTLAEEIKTTKVWLKDAGLSETMPLTIGEWVFSSKGEEESTEKAAAYAIHLLKAMMDNGIYRHSATSIYDQIGWEDGSWAHVGFFTIDGIIRAKWNSFKAVDKLSGQRIKAETTDENHVIAISFKENNKVSILTSHFMTPKEVAFQAAIDSFSDHSNHFVNFCIQNKGTGQNAFYNLLIAYLLGKRSIEDLGNLSIKYCGLFPDYLRNDLINSKIIAYQVYNEELPYKANPREVQLNIRYITPGTYHYKKYIIDGDMNEIHSNPCRYNKKTESSPSNTECGVDGALDQAINQAKMDATDATTNYLLSIGYQQNQIDEIETCLQTLTCDINDLIANYCQINPSECTNISNDVNEAQKLYQNLLYRGTYITTNSTTYTIPIFIDRINNLKEVSLEGSKQEKLITISDGTYSETITSQPYSVMLIEISTLP